MQTTYFDDVFPGVALTCVTTEKFKTGCISVSFVTTLNRKDASMNALISRVLRRGCDGLPDIYQISSALDDLYGARIESFIRKKGELQCIGFYSDFPDDRYLPGNNRLLEDTTALLGRILLSPSISDGCLRYDYVESEKNILIDDIHASINDKGGYVIDKLLAEMCSNEPFGINKLGYEAEIQAITAETLTLHYYKLLESARIEILYCGVASPERVLASVKEALSNLPVRKVIGLTPTLVIEKPFQESPRRFEEELDIAQGKMAIGYRLGRKPGDTLNYPALMVFNSIFGSGATSKLFLNVREKLSLCYYISSMTERHKEVMIVSSGVDFTKFDTVLSEIQIQLNCIKNGDFNDTDLVTSKRLLASSLRAAFDRPESIEGLYFDSRIAAHPYDPAKLHEGVSEVKPDDIISLSSGIAADTIYCLKGREGVSNNEA